MAMSIVSLLSNNYLFHIIKFDLRMRNTIDSDGPSEIECVSFFDKVNWIDEWQPAQNRQ